MNYAPKYSQCHSVFEGFMAVFSFMEENVISNSNPFQNISFLGATFLFHPFKDYKLLPLVKELLPILNILQYVFALYIPVMLLRIPK